MLFSILSEGSCFGRFFQMAYIVLCCRLFVGSVKRLRIMWNTDANGLGQILFSFSAKPRCSIFCERNIVEWIIICITC
jgi:hypothetical protein